MLRIIIPEKELFDERNQSFFTVKAQEIQLEHSLVSLSKWESKWCKPFLSKEDKTFEETVDYIRAMTVTQNVDPTVYNRIDKKIISQVTQYIQAPMTATTLPETKGRSREIITSEIIYYWMITFQIPFECQKWHLNRLLTLINVCNIKNKPAGKMSKAELAKRTRELNAARRAELNTKG